ncbi:MAG TPA: alpha/beta hydrolase, partial [Blastocatellia bacterium]|nr:alpha/beta hydrolase [Blastocatellia bacterium]
LGPPPNHWIFGPASQKMRTWIEKVREIEQRDPHSYPNLSAAVSRMKEANPHLSDEVAEHLTLHGTNWNADGSLTWKFDNYARPFSPYGHNIDDVRQILGEITCPVQLYRGIESWSGDPEADGRAQAIRNYRLINVPRAGHWVHHDQLDVFLKEATRFLSEP